METVKAARVTKRKIGALSLIDLAGNFTGPMRALTEKEIYSSAGGDSSAAVVLNLKEVESIDLSGAKLVVENLMKRKRAGLIRGNEQVMRMIYACPTDKSVNVLNSEEDLAQHFGKEMAQGNPKGKDKRLFRRIDTALPLTISHLDKNGREHQFKAVVTNMSEGGLFAEYIDLKDAAKTEQIINPYELNLLKLLIKAPDGVIEAEGKVAHVRTDGPQVGVGIEFYRVKKREKERIKLLLSQIEK